MAASRTADCVVSTMVGSTIFAGAVWSSRANRAAAPIAPPSVIYAYPCQEKGGVIFTYMGPDEPPLLPNYEFLNQPAGHFCVYKVYHECNYLQANEGNIDPVHLSFLHRFLEHKEERYTGVRGMPTSPIIT